MAYRHTHGFLITFCKYLCIYISNKTKSGVCDCSMICLMVLTNISFASLYFAIDLEGGDSDDWVILVFIVDSVFIM